MVTELGRQPWIVYGRMRGVGGVTDSQDVVVAGVDDPAVLHTGDALILILRRMATGGPAVATEPKELVPA